MAVPPPVGAADALLDEARQLAAGDPVAEARVLTAEAFNGPDNDPVTAELTERAIALARRVGDPLAESAALDQFTSIQLARGEVRAAADSAVQRIGLLAPLPVTAVSALEFFDAFGMAADCTIAAGDLPAARRLAEGLCDLPFHREEAHLATGRLIVVAALAGALNEAVVLSERYREGWERAGRPRAGNLGRGAYAAALVHGLRGNEEARAAWLGIVAAVKSPMRPLSEIHYNEFFDALLLLHQGHPGQALQVLDTPPEQFRTWYSGQWRPWYAALWAEAAALTGHSDAADRIHRARLMAADNPIAAAMVERAASLNTPGGNNAAMTKAAAALHAAGCRYQWARTLVLAGGADRVRGEAALAAMGTSPMAVLPD
jgi:hypothetical protein